MSGPKYYLSKDGEFVIENYNSAPPFSSFFPGISGIFGCPMWVFYTNRGQGVTSAGVNDKDGAIIEFQPANKAYRLVDRLGFRTFLKVNGKYLEPFAPRAANHQEMRISESGFRLSETDEKLKLKVDVTYFTVPNEKFPALARVLEITNLAKSPKKIELIDGLPIIVPFGFVDGLLKRISQTIAAWCLVENLENGAPFFRLKVAPADISETKLIEKGHFHLAFAEQGGKETPVDYVIDPAVVFGENTCLEIPENITAGKIRFAGQVREGIIPSAFAGKSLSLPAGDSARIYSLFGQIDSLVLLNRIKAEIANRDFFERKYRENRELIAGICSAMATASASKEFDLYSRQTFLDNVLRGGLPLNFGDKQVYVYYRKHGDMERDYNDFKLMPTYLSQGTGNYRDINQNRRNDVFFNPDAGEGNLARFFNLIQLDGYNPLIVLGSKYVIREAAAADKLIKKHLKNPTSGFKEALLRPFIPGAVLKNLDESGAEYLTSLAALAEELIARAERVEGAMHGEGFWIDHGFYNLDLLESFECLYPERIEALLFDKKTFTFYDNEHVVLPRKEKYCLSGGRVRQYHSVRTDSEKSSLMGGRGEPRNAVRVEAGRGAVYKTTLAAKLICMAVNKAASFDAAGIGLEMEADKPDWYDALNGLPGLFGSSLSETLELKRFCRYLLDRLPAGRGIVLPLEIKEFIDRLIPQLSEAVESFQAWDKATEAKEDYRRRTKLGLSGQEVELSAEAVSNFLNLIIARCNRGTKKCLKAYGNYFTYFINEVAEYETTADNSIRVKKFNQKPLPLFLEGFVHALKVERDKPIYERVKQSPLYDRKLKMYKVNASLAETPLEIGRARIFSPGWLENESVWLHMEYKYMLELLKAGMYEEFFADFKKVLVPFMDPQKYKRSILENSSFIASSAHPNPADHGRGFVARLSGGTAEFIDMWLIMMTGKKIFRLDEKGKLIFQLSPVIPAWLFKKGKLTFNLLGSIPVAYENPKRKATFGAGAVKPAAYRLVYPGKEVEIKGPLVTEPHAGGIRDKKVGRIVVTLE